MLGIQHNPHNPPLFAIGCFSRTFTTEAEAESSRSVPQFSCETLGRRLPQCHPALAQNSPTRLSWARRMLARMVSGFARREKSISAPTQWSGKPQKLFINPSASQVASLFSRRPEILSKCEQAFLLRLESEANGIWALRLITQEFMALMRNRDLTACRVGCTRPQRQASRQ
jgi:hypothetical protein